MALYKFAEAIMAGQPIDVYNHGRMKRDFTYIDDIVEGVLRVTEQIAAPNDQWSGAKPDPATSRAPYRLYNIGNSQPVELGEFIAVLEQELGRVAEKRYMEMQSGDVPETYADVTALEDAVGYRPQIGIDEGIRRFRHLVQILCTLPSFGRVGRGSGREGFLNFPSPLNLLHLPASNRRQDCTSRLREGRTR